MDDLIAELTDVAPGVVVLRLKGRADSRTVSAMMPKVNLISAKRPSKVVVDMGELSFLSSLPLGEIVAMNRAVKLHKGKVALAAVQPSVLEMMKAVRIDQVMGCYATVDDALAAE